MKSKEDGSKKITYVRVKSAKDLARLASGNDFSSRNLLAYSKGGRSRIFLLGERIANNVIAYYFDAEKICRGMLYTIDEYGEELELRGNDPGMEKNFIDVFQADMHLLEGKIKKKDISWIRMRSTEELVKLAIKSSVKEESVKHLFLFNFRGKSIIGGFDLVEELNDDSRNFYYSMKESAGDACFVKYDYKTGGIEFTDRVREYSYMYLKIINLAEAFPFFSMPD